MKKPKTPKYPDGGSTSVAKPRILSEEDVAFAQLPKWKQEAIKKQNLIQGSRKQEEKLSVGKNLTKDEKETNDKISRRIKYPFSDLGIAAGNIASYLTRFHGLSEEEIVKATNNISGTLDVTNDIALHALANELGGAGTMKALSKTNKLKKIETSITNKYKAEDFRPGGKHYIERTGKYEKPTNPDYLTDFKSYTIDNLQNRLSKPVQKGIPNPIKIADDIIPRLDPLLFLEDGSLMDISPLNMLPFYGNKLKGKDKAFRKFGNSLDHVIESKTLSPKGGSKFRMGKDQIINEGNWAALNRTWEKYPGTYAAEFNFKTPGSNLGYTSSNSRSGVLITDAAGNKLPDVPLSDPGLQFHRRLPFSTRYVPINKEKLINNNWQLATQGTHLQSLAEKYGYGLGAASTFGAMSGKTKQTIDKYNEYTIDPLINLAEEHYNNMKKLTPLTNKKYKNGGAVDEFKNVGLFAADMMLAEWAPNAIKQDQYADTKFGKQLGNVSAVNESLSSQSPISKNLSKNWNDNKTGYNQTQMDYYKQAQPIAKTGSKIGEMWTASAFAGMGGAGMGGGAAAGGASAGAGAGAAGGAAGGMMSNPMMMQLFQQGMQQGLNAQYDPMANMQDPSGNDAKGMKQQNPYLAANGGFVPPNAELEKQENVLMPNGQFGQFNGPSHDNGGIPTNLPQGTKVFSDRLKMGKTGKTFAQLNKPNNTTKEDKILEDSKSTSVAKATASLMKLAKQKNSDELFAAQEALKQSKVDRYTMKLGGIVNYPDGGKTPYNQGFIPDTNYSGTNAVGFPVDKFGRKLTPEEMTGFSRPGYSYGKGTVAGASGSTGINPLTGHAYQPLGNAGGVPRVTQLGTFGTENPTYEQPTNMTDAQFIEYNRARLNLPKQANGGMIKYKPGGTVGEDEPIIQVPGSEPSNLYLGDPTEGFTTENWRDKYSNTKNLTPDQAAQLDYTAQHPTPDKQRGGIPWGDMLKQGVLGIANNLGNIYDLNRAKDVEVDKYDRMNPSLLDPTASLRDADRQGRIAEYNLRNASVGNSGAYMANEVANRTNTTLTKDKIQREYQNMNAGIKNNAQMYNIEQHKAEDIANMQNRAKSRDIKGNAISNIGSNIMGQYKDSQMTKADMDKIELIKTMYPAIKNNKEMMAYYKAKYPKFNWKEIEK